MMRQITNHSKRHLVDRGLDCGIPGLLDPDCRTHDSVGRIGVGWGGVGGWNGGAMGDGGRGLLEGRGLLAPPVTCACPQVTSARRRPLSGHQVNKSPATNTVRTGRALLQPPPP